MERFLDGGFFRGKNFVFDERVAVAPAAVVEPSAVGSCLACGGACDDYGPRLRCCACRLLILVCPSCVEEVGGLRSGKASKEELHLFQQMPG